MANRTLINDSESSGMTEPLPSERRKAVKSSFRVSSMPRRHLIKSETL
jgi:hypothetical protein